MRNQQIKKVNRVFFSGQDEEKQKWLEQMAAEGWHLISSNSFVYSFQRVSSELAAYQPSYKTTLGKDFQKSMPLFQEPKQEWVALLDDGNVDQNLQSLSTSSRLNDAKSNRVINRRRVLVGAITVLLFLIISTTKIAIISTGDFMSLFKLQFLTGILFVGASLVTVTLLILKGFLKHFSPACKTKK